MIKGMMGPEHGTKAVFGSAKAADVRRAKAGSVRTAKLPTSLDEMREISSLSNDGPRASTGRAPDS